MRRRPQYFVASTQITSKRILQNAAAFATFLLLPNGSWALDVAKASFFIAAVPIVPSEWGTSVTTGSQTSGVGLLSVELQIEHLPIGALRLMHETPEAVQSAWAWWAYGSSSTSNLTTNGSVPLEYLFGQSISIVPRWWPTMQTSPPPLWCCHGPSCIRGEL